MSIYTAFILEFNEEIDLMLKHGIDIINRYKKAEMYVGPSRAISLIEFAYTPIGKTIIHEIVLENKEKQFLNNLKETNSNYPKMDMLNLFKIAQSNLC